MVIWALNKGGPKLSLTVSAVLLLLGNWIRYAGTRAGNSIFGLAMFGQILIGLAQPFCLSAPTRYSDLWFTGKGRTSATAIATLANPFGGALGQLMGPILATKSSDIPNMVLYVSIIVSKRKKISPLFTENLSPISLVWDVKIYGNLESSRHCTDFGPIGRLRLSNNDKEADKISHLKLSRRNQYPS